MQMGGGMGGGMPGQDMENATGGAMRQMGGGMPGQDMENATGSAMRQMDGGMPGRNMENATGGAMRQMGGGMPGQDMENATGSAMRQMDGGMPGQDMEDATGGAMRQMDSDMSGEDGENVSESEDIPTYIRISGGKLAIVNETGNDADGLDSNGSIYITGGEIRISLTSNGSNSAIDYASENSESVCEISGGTVVACGASGMAEAFSQTSSQGAILYNFSEGAEAGTTIELAKTDGTVLLSYEVPCGFSSANLSSPELELGETYTLNIGDQTEEITLEDISTTYGESSQGMGGGRMGRGSFQAAGQNMASGSAVSRAAISEIQTEEAQTEEMQTEEVQSEGAQTDETQSERGMMGAPEMGQGTVSGSSVSQAAFTGGRPEGGGPGGQGFDENEMEEETEISAGTALSELDTEVWYELGASVLILLIGLCFVKIYRAKS